MKTPQETWAIRKFILSYPADGQTRVDRELKAALVDYLDSKRKGEWDALAFLNSWNNAEKVLERLIEQKKLVRYVPAVKRLPRHRLPAEITYRITAVLDQRS
jgi:hypothetical protein